MRPDTHFQGQLLEGECLSTRKTRTQASGLSYPQSTPTLSCQAAVYDALFDAYQTHRTPTVLHSAQPEEYQELDQEPGMSLNSCQLRFAKSAAGSGATMQR